MIAHKDEEAFGEIIGLSKNPLKQGKQKEKRKKRKKKGIWILFVTHNRHNRVIFSHHP